MKITNDINSLSDIGNGNYFASHYYNYINSHQNTNTILIDLNNFKSINDTYGHIMGDYCLLFFSKLLINAFRNSLVARLHGDEFAIVTTKTEKEIEDTFNYCMSCIKSSYEMGTLAVPFSFSAGSVLSSEVMDDTLEIADSMMYQAKKNKILYQPFNKSIIDTKEEMESFSKSLNEQIRNSLVDVKEREFYNWNGFIYPLKEIYSVSKNGTPLIMPRHYEYLRSTSKIYNYDLYMLENALKSKRYEDTIIPVDNTTLSSSLSYHDLINSLSNTNNIVAGIDLRNYSSEKLDKLISEIMILKNKGFKIMLDKVDLLVPDQIWYETSPEYISFSDEFINKALKNKKLLYLLERKLEECNNLSNTKAVFKNMDDEEKFKLIESRSPKTAIYSGKALKKAL